MVLFSAENVPVANGAGASPDLELDRNTTLIAWAITAAAGSTGPFFAQGAVRDSLSSIGTTQKSGWVRGDATSAESDSIYWQGEIDLRGSVGLPVLAIFIRNASGAAIVAAVNWLVK